MAFLTNDPLPQCLQTSSVTPLLLAQGHPRGNGRYLSNVKCLLDRTQPGLPMKEARAATATHDYERHGTTTLFAALNVLDGTVLGRCMQRHRHQEFIRFLNAVEAAVPPGRLVHAILDNYA